MTSRTTVATPYATTLLSPCATHPNSACIEIVLSSDPDNDHLSFTFVSFRHTKEPSQVGVVEDLLIGCKPYRPPAGYVLVNNKTVHFHYDPGTHPDILFEARNRLEERLNERIRTSNATHRRDPQTHLVHRRGPKVQPATLPANVW